MMHIEAKIYWVCVKTEIYILTLLRDWSIIRGGRAGANWGGS
jgi:hypothetical protein